MSRADQPHPAPQPRVDEFGVKWCTNACLYFAGNLAIGKCAFYDDDRRASIYIQCEPQARLDAAELARAKIAIDDLVQRNETLIIEHGVALNDQIALRAENARRLDLLEAAWGIIANASRGDWKKEGPIWLAAAERWRDQYHATLTGTPAPEDKA